MNEIDYRAFYDRVGSENGWDFSRVQCRVEGAEAELYREVSRLSKPSDLLLDIGTGGGEALLAVREAAHLLVGIDRSSGMIRTAEANRSRFAAANVRFLRMEAERLDFPERFFDIVSCRHSAFDAVQVAKVLTDEGTFLTQQVGEGDKINLKRAFGRGQSYGVPDGTLMADYVQRLTEAGFAEVSAAEYDTTEYYRSPEDLLFLLKHTPIIPEFGRHPRDFEILAEFVAAYGGEQGIRTNAKRFVIRAKKTSRA
ncbi:class I SAM-dependent methyltransferase [Cohnella nanjingensis]|uniref:Class I SAM-dependent methyltransferase n=1 Tax=Cohnella nanjingensis TaxID=1387779 RepID=A0A7X0RQL8_9BACL|nr:class I SAM-dependent methyltransferase [Cohnella nanjingensis]MBB6670474.1 class I SAM-dependent methyltransferase [Cohnella nanjingensis]